MNVKPIPLSPRAASSASDPAVDAGRARAMEKAEREFHAMLLREMLKPLTQALFGNDGLTSASPEAMGSAGNETYGYFLEQALSQQLSQAWPLPDPFGRNASSTSLNPIGSIEPNGPSGTGASSSSIGSSGSSVSIGSIGSIGTNWSSPIPISLDRPFIPVSSGQTRLPISLDRSPRPMSLDRTHQPSALDRSVPPPSRETSGARSIGQPAHESTRIDPTRREVPGSDVRDSSGGSPASEVPSANGGTPVRDDPSGIPSDGDWSDLPTSLSLGESSLATHFANEPQSSEGRELPGAVDLPEAEIRRASRLFDLPENLVRAVVITESGGRADAVSSKGAIGYMQVLPSTGKEMGASNVRDPWQNLYAGAKYLRKQLDRFGNIEHALAAYNAGPGAVERHGGIPPYRETQNYVKRVLSRMDRLDRSGS